MDDQTFQTIDMVITIVAFVSPLVFVISGFIIGSILERKHFESIRERERRWANLPVLPTRIGDCSREPLQGELVTASVVVSLDYFKRFLASLRNIFGGRVRAYESLLDRAKREAILRLKEQVSEADVIVNLRLETSSLAYVQSRKKGIGGVEVLAYGTAIRYRSA